MPALVSLTVADSPECWERLGFVVDEGTVRVGVVTFVCAGSVTDGAKGITDWVLFDSTRVLPGSVDGVLTAAASERVNVPAPKHPNGVSSIDHLVLRTPDLERTVAVLEGLGIACRRRRNGGAYGSTTLLQAFFWLDSPTDSTDSGDHSDPNAPNETNEHDASGRVLLEVVGEADVDPARANEPAQFFGIAFACADLDATIAFFSDLAKPPIDAVQPGRRISSISSRAGSSVAIALLSPHVG